MKSYTPADLPRNHLAGAAIAVLGFGNQGHAHALNLRDRGARVVVGARAGKGRAAAEREGFETREIARAVAGAGVVAVLLPDEVQGEVFTREIAPALEPGAALVFAHGFAIAFGAVKPPAGHDVVLVAPKGQGHFLRRSFVAGVGVPCLVAVESDASGSALAKALSYAHLIGCLDAGAIETTCREEAVTDLFGEQAVLCGGVPALVKAAYDTLVERGYSPAVAYIECLHELKIIADLMFEGGLHYMRERISATAAWGSFESGSRIVTDATREALRGVLDDVASGAFARAWLEESRAGGERLAARIRGEADDSIERAGAEVRSLMQRAQPRREGKPS